MTANQIEYRNEPPRGTEQQRHRRHNRAKPSRSGNPYERKFAFGPRALEISFGLFYSAQGDLEIKPMGTLGGPSDSSGCSMRADIETCSPSWKSFVSRTRADLYRNS
jgi:hypothetical protein